MTLASAPIPAHPTEADRAPEGVPIPRTSSRSSLRRCRSMSSMS